MRYFFNFRANTFWVYSKTKCKQGWNYTSAADEFNLDAIVLKETTTVTDDESEVDCYSGVFARKLKKWARMHRA